MHLHYETHIAGRSKHFSRANIGPHAGAAAAIRLSDMLCQRMVQVSNEIARDLLELIVQVLLGGIHFCDVIWRSGPEACLSKASDRRACDAPELDSRIGAWQPNRETLERRRSHLLFGKESISSSTGDEYF